MRWVEEITDLFSEMVEYYLARLSFIQPLPLLPSVPFLPFSFPTTT